MTQISILAGIKSDTNAAVLDSAPVNLEPSLANSNISQGYLTSAPGITTFSLTATGRDRAAINWNDVLYRVQGSKLISVTSNGIVTILGDVGDDGNFAFLDYSFDRLAISSNSNLFYYQSGTITQVTDPNVGVVKDVIWFGGYFLYTDGTDIINTDIANPYVVNPTSYGSAEADPDGIFGLLALRNEVLVIGRYTVQAIQAVGGSGFPFQTVLSATIPKGAIGAKAFCEFNNSLAFVGSGRDEAISVYIASAGDPVSITTSYIINILQSLTPIEQSLIQLEKIVHDNEQRLYIHLPNKTLVYHLNASISNQAPVWTILAGGTNADQQYPMHNIVFCYDKYIGAHPTTGLIGYLDPTISTHNGAIVGWQFETSYVYNAGGGFTLTDIELVATTGRTPLGSNPTLFFSYSRDGINFSQEQAISQGKQGEYNKRLAWRPMCNSNNYMNLRFRGANTSIATILRCEAQIEGQMK
jgi:hypothetical protein